MVATTDTIDWIDTKGRVDANHDPLDSHIEHDHHEGTIDTITSRDDRRPVVERAGTASATGWDPTYTHRREAAAPGLSSTCTRVPCLSVCQRLTLFKWSTPQAAERSEGGTPLVFSPPSDSESGPDWPK
ncbi:unnamed protein product [Phytophthora fragariaefolia]|uniref:Unnamed protein product n=1 Tax=Phytophthora fragariaefolia TaxID=1490495 RepID=A0A9W6YBI5_9STRA|nr:unnamed protein product [Phytophthora fragariaefolia]